MADHSIYIAGHRGLAGSALLRLYARRAGWRVITRTHAELELRDTAADDPDFDFGLLTTEERWRVILRLEIQRQIAQGMAGDRAPIPSVRRISDLAHAGVIAWLVGHSVKSQIPDEAFRRALTAPKRGVGETTDIVEKEMYTFEDRLNGDSLTLRPEATAGVVRATVEHNLLYDGGKRMYYMGPMFRHERPQKGRYRQFHQIGAEALGFGGAEVDAEMILMADQLWHMLGLKDIRLEINSLGQPGERLQHRAALIAYFEQHQDQLDEDAKRRLHSNPLRILDTKNPAMQALVEGAPTEALARYFECWLLRLQGVYPPDLSMSTGAAAFLDGVRRVAPRDVESLDPSRQVLREIELVHRKLIAMHLEREPRSVRVLNELRRQ